MGKRRYGARQDVLLLTETGDIDGFKLEAESAYIVSPDTVEAWELDYNQQVIHEKSGRNIQVISERDKKPLRVYRFRPTLEGQSTDVIASRTQDEELAFMNTVRAKNRMLTWVGIIAALFAVVISIVVLAQLKNSHEVARMLGLAIGVGGLLRRRVNPAHIVEDKKAIEALQDTGAELVDTLIIAEKTGELLGRQVSRDLIPDDSIERNYKGKPCYLLGLDKFDKLWAIEPVNKIEVGQSPKDCFIALQYEKEVNGVYNLPEGIGEKIKLGFFYALCIVELIVLFLIITAASGGSV